MKVISGLRIKFSIPRKVDYSKGLQALGFLVFSVGAALWFVPAAQAQTTVTTQHNDISRTGANTNETILKPANVNTNSFGKLFSIPVDGWVYAQPLYMPSVTMGAGTAQPNTTHNVVFVATENDSVYAFDADSNTGANANPLWHASLIDAAHGVTGAETTVPAADVQNIPPDITPVIGITSTPVIDPSTNPPTIYVVAKSKSATECSNSNPTQTYCQRLHALDITTGAEKPGGWPILLSAFVQGNGNGSSSGRLNWDPKWQNNRAGLLLLNGIVYIGFGSHMDNGPWHGWILAYNTSTLQQTGAWCTTPNAAGAGIWMGGTGLAADVPTGKPFGRIFTATGNGTFAATAPNYTNAMDYGDSIIKLDLTNGVPTMVSNGTTVGDAFTPFDQIKLNNNDTDVASGGVVLVPGASGGDNALIQTGKTGRVYVIDREKLGGYTPSNTTDPEQKAILLGGLWGAPAYWNGKVYIWGTSDSLKAFSFVNGVLSANNPTTSNETVSSQFSPTPSVSANGNTNGIVWSMRTDNYPWQGRAILYAHDANNLNLLYSSESNITRDNPGNSVKFVVPTVVNGKVYVGTESQLSVYGLLNGATQAAMPSISPASESFSSSSLQVTITDTTAGATIYYTKDGSTPTTAAPSIPYSGPFPVTQTTTVNAIAAGTAAGTGLLASPVASATYTLTTQVVTPTFNPLPGSYTASSSVTISTTTANTTIYYTLNGATPTTSSSKYTGPVPIGATETLSAIAVDNAGVLKNSPVATGVYTIDLGGVTSINLSGGFTAGAMEWLGNAKLNGTALELTDGGTNEVAAAWYQVQANIQSFTTDFNFQTMPASASTADGFTFTMQGNNATAIGPGGGGLGYGPSQPGGTPGIGSSVAVKFDLYNNAGEGRDSTGLYINGASPTTPYTDMSGSPVNLHSGDVFHVHMTYDGTTLTMTITDTTTNGTFTTSWAAVNIPSIVGGNAAYVGFTAGTGGSTATQEILNWTFTSTSTSTSAPTITSLNPTSGAVGAAVTITGTNFGSSQGTSTVTFNGKPATVTSWSATSIMTAVPTGATTGSVVVTAGGVASNAVSFTITSGGTVINLGSGFTAGAMILNGKGALNGTRLRLTDGGSYEASSAWYNTVVNIQQFTTNFSFQITGGTNPTADGFAFVIQGGASTALGPAGGGLGYGGTGGLANSIAVKFDLYSNNGEGPDSTGLYVNGASPTTPFVDMRSSGVNLHTTDVFNVQISYNGTNLTMQITDTTTNATFTQTWPINIATTVGGNTAYVGFTGGTGGNTAIQEIIGWTM